MMKIKDNTPVIKGMIFAGCSFTWGQGLWYYSNLPTLKEDSPYGFSSSLLTRAHTLFQEKVRWPAKVASHFNSYELVHPENGGANDQFIRYWSASLDNNIPVEVPGFKQGTFDTIQKINYSEISHVVVQLTYWPRSTIHFPYDGVNISTSVQTTWDDKRVYKKAFEKWMKAQGLDPTSSDLGEFHTKVRLRDLSAVKNFFIKCEKHGIKTVLFSWTHEFLDDIKNDNYLLDRFMTFEYNGNNYQCLEKLVSKERLAIEHDTEYFDQPPIDGHPTLKCQQIIADNVIKFIEKKYG